MANLSAAEVAKLIREIDELRRTAEDTLIDQAKLEQRYAAATEGLLDANGSFSGLAWENLAAERQAEIAARITALRAELERLRADGAAGGDGPADPSSIMHRGHASNFWGIALTLFAAVGVLLDLWAVREAWGWATTGEVLHKPGKATASDQGVGSEEGRG